MGDALFTEDKSQTDFIEKYELRTMVAVPEVAHEN